MASIDSSEGRAAIDTLEVKPGATVRCAGRRYRVTHLLGLDQVLLFDLENGKRERLDISVLEPDDGKEPVSKDTDLELVSDDEWKIALERLEVLRPLVEPESTMTVEERAKETGVHRTTIYRWLQRFNTTGLTVSLKPTIQGGGRGNGRLVPEVEKIVQDSIENYYLKDQKHGIKDTWEKIRGVCRIAGLPVPAVNTVRNRIIVVSEEQKMRRREGGKKASEAFEPSKGSFPGADWPLAIVQIDHTKLDIVLVDDINRLPVGRPWITLAIDVCSRVVTGFYVSFDPPSAMSVGLCLAHSFLGKEEWLARFGIKTQWPVWGFPGVIHADNAKEFRGKMLQRACKNHKMDLIWRPVAKPRYGAHIERLMGTFATEIHKLPGTTFSNTREKGDYDSEGKAALTLSEFETWLTTFIVEVYHQRVHSSIGMSPLQRFQEGLLGSDKIPGRGLPERIVDDYRLKLNFMPYEKRSVQQYGVQLDEVHYYHDVLRPWIKAVDAKTNRRRKFLFRRDPRDISILYFFDPELERYFEIPYRDTSRPPISLWELRAAKNRLKFEGIKEVNEDLIFDALDRMREIENQAVKETKKQRRQSQRKRHNFNGVKELRNSKAEVQPVSPRKDGFIPEMDDLDIQPFEESFIRPKDEQENG
ncbi:MAG: Mu transposase C-terminal domain-containing protein [Desulfuromonadales bacterium]|nr:Mu transposase C-terminal domain-containing protein [Desulfuromonadales bacterium]